MLEREKRLANGKFRLSQVERNLYPPPTTNLSEIFNKDIKKRQIYIKSFSTAREGKEFCFFFNHVLQSKR
jgi:hypothetical protein